MKCRRSLKRSIISFFVITCLVLVVGYTFFLSQYLTRGLDLFVEFRLEEVSTNYLHALAENPAAPLPHEGHITGYTSYADLPSDVRNTYDARQLQDKPFRYVHVEKSHYKIHTLKRPDGKTIYMVFTTLEGELSQDAHSKFDFYYFYTPAVGGLLAIAIVMTLAFALFKGMASPVEKLHEWIVTLSPENLDKTPMRFKYDEFNSVADLFLAASRRLVAGVEREKQFQKYASHELRTPIAVIQNNLELMERQGITDDPRYKSSHSRMTKAVRNMRHLTVALLWLSRDSETALPSETVKIDDCIREIIDENAYLLEGKDISLSTALEPVNIHAPRTLAHIILTNLVRNAFQHTCEGEIRIANTQGVIEVGNPADTPPENRHTANPDGYGLGLQLSRQLVTRLDWKIDVEETDGQFLVRVRTAAPKSIPGTAQS